jgi:hypothetical protein
MNLAEPDKLVNFIVSYKIQNYNKTDYDNDGVLINYNSIRHNYHFVKFIYDNWLCNIKNESSKKKYFNHVESVALLTEIPYDVLLNYFDNF